MQVTETYCPNLPVRFRRQGECGQANAEPPVSEEHTRTKTLWSETQFEILYLSLKKNRPDSEIAAIVADLRKRGYRPYYLVHKARDKVGMAGAARLAALIKRIGKGGWGLQSDGALRIER